MIRLVVFDLDNTLAEHGKGMQASDIEKLKQLENKGIKIAISNTDEQIIPSKLNDLIKRNNVTAIQMTPSRMQLLLDNINDKLPNCGPFRFLSLYWTKKYHMAFLEISRKTKRIEYCAGMCISVYVLGA